MKNYAVYLRVSTQKQGRSGLGIDAQRVMCNDFIKHNGGVCAKEFQDVESGTHRNRKGLQEAIRYCKDNSCPLVIAKLDRLARDVEFCFKVVNTGIEIHFTDMPFLNTLMLGVFASVAQYERELTSDRTKRALAVKKAQGCKLGAANPTFRKNYQLKDEETKIYENMIRGMKKRKNFLESKDVVAFIKVLERVFPDAHKDGVWNFKVVNTRYEQRMEMLSLMRDYKALDSEGELFKTWNLNQDLDCIELHTKVANMITSLKRSLKA